jgi:hypothetical protein
LNPAGPEVVSPEVVSLGRQDHVADPIQLRSTPMANNLPFDWALNLADALSEYTSTIFKELIDADSTTRKGKAPGIPDLLRISVHLAAECEHAATVLATTYKNQSTL